MLPRLATMILQPLRLRLWWRWCFVGWKAGVAARLRFSRSHLFAAGLGSRRRCSEARTATFLVSGG